MSIYEDKGFRNREDYLEQLTEEYGIELETVRIVADMLGSREDFDRLMVALEDMEMEMCDENVGE